MSDNITIGKRIQKLRKEKGMTQESLSEKLGVSAQAVSKWENGYSCPDISILPTLAKVLGVTVDELLSGAQSTAEESEAVEGEFVPDPENESNQEGWNIPKHKIKKLANYLRVGQIVGGIFVVFVGVLLILTQATDLLGDVSFWSVLWPSFIIFIGISGLIKHWPNGFFMAATLVGTYFLLDNIAVIPENFSGGWIVVGIIIIVCGIFTFIPKKKSPVDIHMGGETEREYSSDGGYISYDGSFGEDNVCFDGGTLTGGNIDMSFGTVRVDLRSLTSVSQGAVLNVDMSFGSAEIWLPRCVRTNIVKDTSFGGVNMRGNADPGAPYELTLNCDISFGGVEVIYK